MANEIVAERFSLFREYYDELVGYLTAKLRSRDQALDIAQETFLRVLTEDSGIPVSQPRAFLYKIASNLTIDFFRRQKRWREEPFDTPVHRTDLVAPAEQWAYVESREQTRLVHAAVVELPRRCREVFILHLFEGRSHSEIAARLGISKSMVEKHLARAISYCYERYNQPS